METLLIQAIPNLWQFITIIVWFHLSVLIAYLIQWNPKFTILQLDAFRIKPWICDICMNFHVNMVGNVLLAYIWDPFFLLWGLITASVLAYSVSLVNK